MSIIKHVIGERDDLRIENDLYKRYVNYLHSWYKEHAAPEFEGMEPVCFKEFCDNEAAEGEF